MEGLLLSNNFEAPAQSTVAQSEVE